MESTCKTLTLEQVINFNRQQIKVFGGLPFVEPDNFKTDGSSLIYILEAIETTFFGVDLHPTITDKAAAIGWTISASHVFNDANKRTGLITTQLFLDINDYNLALSENDYVENEVEAILRVAKSELSLDDFKKWVRERVKPNKK